ncbi:alpha/beta fold hydrolase [Nocardioides sp. Iso805N]|uniref:alpha/beta fold hydrolase n=1 Tax=Nocardioides sp. Iso805N TaxID=1283287 RepID=UPI00039EBE7F|nr:alpha/beta fold hydrolase [Nocardioides sp. Iso805N]
MTFVLIHGGSHGSWCWDKVRPLLEEQGFAVITPDLPMEDAERGVNEWADVVVDDLNAVTGDVVLVGHSLSGLALPVVATRRPVARMIFLGAMVPRPGTSYYEYLATPEGAGAVTMPFDRVVLDDLGRTVVPETVAREVFYADCAEPGIVRALDRLVPSAPAAFLEPCPIAAWPSVESSYVLMTEDRAVDPAWSRRVCVERLGIAPIELPGSHSPFLSRPDELVKVLVGLV